MGGRTPGGRRRRRAGSGCCEGTRRCTNWCRRRWRRARDAGEDGADDLGDETIDYGEVYRRPVGVANSAGDRSSARAGALPGERHRAQSHSQRARTGRPCTRSRRADHRQHADVPVGRGRRQAGAGTSRGRRRSGSTKATGTSLRAHNEPLEVPALRGGRRRRTGDRGRVRD